MLQVCMQGNEHTRLPLSAKCHEGISNLVRKSAIIVAQLSSLGYPTLRPLMLTLPVPSITPSSLIPNDTMPLTDQALEEVMDSHCQC
jgi:hypothetical protein